MADEGEEVVHEWKVTWFDPFKPDQSRTYRTELTAWGKFGEMKAFGYCPIIEHRVITPGPWQVVQA